MSSHMQHVLYIPASYAAVIYGVVTGGTLLLCLFVGLAKHSRDILMTSCGPDHYEFWPSISTTIGDFRPERQLWRIAFVLCTPFRIGTSIAVFGALWQHACGGMAEVRAAVAAFSSSSLWSSLLHLLRSSALLVLAAFVVDAARMVSAIVWTMVASHESLVYHNLGFGPYIFFCFCMQVLLNVVVRRNQHNVRLYASHRDAARSLRCKRVFFWTETITALGVVGFYLRHYLTCAPASFSLSTLNEWVFAGCNVAYDCSMYYELSRVGWWFSNAPGAAAAACARARRQRPLPYCGSNNNGHGGGRHATPQTGVMTVHVPSPAMTTTATTALLQWQHDGDKDSYTAPVVAASSSSATATAVHKMSSDGSGGGGVDAAAGGSTTSAFAMVSSTSSSSSSNNNSCSSNVGSPALDAAHHGNHVSAFGMDHIHGGSNGDEHDMDDGGAAAGTASDTVVHTLTFYCAPHAATMWLCDVYWWYVVYEMTVQVIQHVYFMPLVLMSLSWEIGLAAVVFALPCVLRVRVLRRWLTGPCVLARHLVPEGTTARDGGGDVSPTHDGGGVYRLPPMYVLLYAVASLSHVQMLVTQQPHRKLQAAAVGPVAVVLASMLRTLYPSSGAAAAVSAGVVASRGERVSCALLDVSASRRRIYAAPLAFVVCMLLRILYISHSPLLVEAFYTGVVGIVGGLVCTTCVLREAVCTPDVPHRHARGAVTASTRAMSVTQQSTQTTTDVCSGKASNMSSTISNRHHVTQPHHHADGAAHYTASTESDESTHSRNSAAAAAAVDEGCANGGVTVMPQPSPPPPPSPPYELEGGGGGTAVGKLHTSAAVAVAVSTPSSGPTTVASLASLHSRNTITALALAHGNGSSAQSPASSLSLLSSSSSPPTWLLGALFGLLLSLFIHMYVSANYLPRLLAIEPYPASLLVVAAFVAGLYGSTSVLAMPPYLARLRTRRTRATATTTTAASSSSSPRPQRRLPSLSGRLRRAVEDVTSSSSSSSSRLVVALPLTPRSFGVALFVSCVVMLYGTRQTNFAYETRHAHYPVTFDSPKEHVDVSAWHVQEDMAGSRWLAFAGGLCMTFLLAALAPVVTEVSLAHLHARRLARQLVAASASAATTTAPLSSSSSSACRAVDDAVVYACEGGVLRSFEFAFLVCTLLPALMYALCTSYPFVPLGWLVRERSRPLLLLHVMLLYVGTLAATRSLRVPRHGSGSGIATTTTTTTTTTSSATAADTATGAANSAAAAATTARRQRALGATVVWCVALLCFAVIVGRASFAPSMFGHPAGLDTVPRYAREVVQVHKALVQLHRERNGATDTALTLQQRALLHETVDGKVHALEAAVLGTSNDTASTMAPWVADMDDDTRGAVWRAAQAMTFVTGMIWTVHFALDNSNVDSLERMVQQIDKTGANVVGLLESDSMHLVNGLRDMVEYVAYHLGFPYTDYGPTALDNTYGCALLSRFPIVRVRRYVAPSPLGELSCIVHAILDVHGLRMHTYVGHFGNTEHWADGLLQSQFLGQLVARNPGPTMWLGYLVTYPGNPERYAYYSDPHARGKLRDAGLEMYVRRPWLRLLDRGGYDEEPPATTAAPLPGTAVDFDLEYKLPRVRHLEGDMHVDASFRRVPPGQPPRTFYLNSTNRYTPYHPRFEFMDRYCQYCMYKTGEPRDEVVAVAPLTRQVDELRRQLQNHTGTATPMTSTSVSSPSATWLQPCKMELFDWWRVFDDSLDQLSDTEVQVIQMRFDLLDSLRDDVDAGTAAKRA